MTMKYTISERTITVETTEKGETLTRETVKALTEHKTDAWAAVERLALSAPEPKSEIDESPDPLEDMDLNYTDVDPSVLASEELAAMVPANVLPAE